MFKEVAMKKGLRWLVLILLGCVFAAACSSCGTEATASFSQQAVLHSSGLIAWGDYDQDGDEDLLAGCTTDQPASIFENDSNGSFDLIQELPCGRSLLGGSQPWADYDGDGDLDLALPGRDESYMYENQEGTFVLDERSDLPAQSSGGAWFQWGDIDGANGPDLVLVGTEFSRVYLNDGTGVLDFGQALPDRDNHSGDLGDFDNDGDLDLVLVGAVPGGGTDTTRFHLEVYRNEDGVLRLYVELAHRGGDVRWVDFDGDGQLDIFVAGRVSAATGYVELWRQDPAGFFTLDSNQPALAALAAQGVLAVSEGGLAWGDINLDGAPELLLSGPTEDACLTRTYRVDDSGQLAENGETGLSGLEVCFSYPGWADFDGDGDLDLAVYASDDEAVHLYANNLR
jgi:hypothetical protein